MPGRRPQPVETAAVSCSLATLMTSPRLPRRIRKSRCSLFPDGRPGSKPIACRAGTRSLLRPDSVFVRHPVHEAVQRIHGIVRVADGARPRLTQPDDALGAAAREAVPVG